MAETAVHTIESRALEALAESKVRDLAELRVEWNDDQLVLSGSVSRFYYKQLAQELVLGACGQICLCNAVHVR